MVKNDGSLFPKIDFCVATDHTSFGIDETGQEIHGSTYVLPRGILKILLIYKHECSFMKSLFAAVVPCSARGENVLLVAQGRVPIGEGVLIRDTHLNSM